MFQSKRKLFGTISLMLSALFLPLGFDAAFLAVMKLTGSYWITDFLFYSLSALLFILYFLSSRKILLAVSLFFFPGGYDALFKLILDYTSSYILTDCIFYIISIIFFMIHLYINKTNIKIEVNKRISQATIDIIKIKSKL